jgi:hypothetical protein
MAGKGIYDEVSYLHRTARDFVESEKYWLVVMQTTGYENFQPEERWANAQLWLLKSPDELSAWSITALCIKSTVIVEQKTGVIQKSYLNELFRLQFWHYHQNEMRGILCTSL